MKSGDPHSDLALFKAELESLEDVHKYEMIFKAGLEGALKNSERKCILYYSQIQGKKAQIAALERYIKTYDPNFPKSEG